MGSLLNADLELLERINSDMWDPVLTRAMLFITDKHNWFPLITAIVLFILIASRRLPRPGNVFQRRNPRVFLLGAVLCVLLSDQTGALLKDRVERIRPNRDPALSVQLNTPLHTAGRRSFPSNHAANSASLAVFTALFYPPLAVPAAVTAFLIGFSRVYLAVHYPLDVISGWLIGCIMGVIVWLILRKRARSPGIAGFANMFRYRQHQFTADPGPEWKKLTWLSLDGHRVKGWLLPGGDDLVVFVHGLGGNALSRKELGVMLRKLGGYSFMLVPLRGSDGHPAWPVTGGVDECHDVLGALQAALDSGFAPDRTVIYGTSMGGAAAAKACALAGNLMPRGVVLHGAFAGFFRSAENRLGPFGSRLLRLLMPISAVRNLERFDPGSWLAMVNGGCRLEYIYGGRDRTSPPKDGRALARVIPDSMSGFTVLENRGHPTGRNTSDDEFAEILSKVIRRILSDRKR